jgi:prepilin peptidase CpaA
LRAIVLRASVTLEQLKDSRMTKAVLLLPATMVLGSLLAVAAASDIRTRRVGNTLNLTILVLGMLFALLLLGWRAGALHFVTGIGLGLLIWFPMFAVRLMGAGDVKLLASCGAWLGWEGMVIATLATGVYGGVLGAFWLLRSHGAMSAMHTVATAVRAPWLMKMRPYEARERLPYAVAIAGGVVTAWWMQYATEFLGGRA